MRGALRIEMPLTLDIDRHDAATLATLDQLKAKRAREVEILSEGPHRTRGPPKGGGGGGRRVPRGNWA